MRHSRATGRHGRYLSPVPFRVFLAFLLAVITSLPTAALTGTFTSAAHAQTAHAQPAQYFAAPTENTHWKHPVTRFRAMLPVTPALRLYVVRMDDTMSGVAVKMCGQARDWTGIYAASRAAHLTAADANLLRIGQALAVDCAYRPAELRFAAPAVSPGSIYLARAAAGPSPAAPTVVTVPVVTVTAGHYSFSGLENLWVSADGPSWAAAHAAEIAECESGGNIYAYNQSGATGLWQILGSVIPGDLYNPLVNALNAVAKFRASNDTFAQWVCR